MLLRTITAVALLSALLGCASPTSHESSYNEGVIAFRAKDYATARTQWAKAVDDGDASAMNNLGYLLFQGLGGAPDLERGLSLWMRAAVLGHSEAQWHLGNAYERGKGVQKSEEEAYAWYRCAIASAQAPSNNRETETEILQDASKSLARLLERLQSDRFGAAEELAKQYVAKYARRRPGA
jgi:hypothetical protein